MKKNVSTTQVVTELVLPILADLGLKLWDVRFEKEGSDWFLRIYIDSPSGISLDDCEAVSRSLDDVLDEKDFIEQSYYLEVSSSGLERELKRKEHFEYALNKNIFVKLIRPLDGVKEFNGILKEYTSDEIVFGDNRFKMADCAIIRTVYKD